ncbi:MAG TPA: hypothetical protein VG755_08770 [Nannocystaceae bacterium]|nr:hypothetical protein [Nannocystaceae bacterium]
MAARVPRRSFASPFVVTLAVACTPATTTTNPPTSTPQNTPVAETPPTETPPTETPEAIEARWGVTKEGKECFTHRHVDCSDPAQSCNPPPPQKYDCPKWDNGDAMSFEGGATIEGVAGGEQCTLYFSGGACPEGASCNPPPPRAVACPKV